MLYRKNMSYPFLIAFALMISGCFGVTVNTKESKDDPDKKVLEVTLPKVNPSDATKPIKKALDNNSLDNIIIVRAGKNINEECNKKQKIYSLKIADTDMQQLDEVENLISKSKLSNLQSIEVTTHSYQTVEKGILSRLVDMIHHNASQLKNLESLVFVPEGFKKPTPEYYIQISEAKAMIQKLSDTKIKLKNFSIALKASEPNNSWKDFFDLLSSSDLQGWFEESFVLHVNSDIAQKDVQMLVDFFEKGCLKNTHYLGLHHFHTNASLKTLFEHMGQAMFSNLKVLDLDYSLKNDTEAQESLLKALNTNKLPTLETISLKGSKANKKDFTKFQKINVLFE